MSHVQSKQLFKYNNETLLKIYKEGKNLFKNTCRETLQSGIERVVKIEETGIYTLPDYTRKTWPIAVIKCMIKNL